MKVLIAAYACDPERGSEPGVGWNIAREMATRHDVWVVTRRKNRRPIERALAADPTLRMTVLYHDVQWLQPFKRLPGGVYVYHYVWHLALLRLVAPVHAEVGFDLVHHLTLGSFRFPTSLHRLGPPLVMGPLGGGEEVPFSFWRGLGMRGAAFEAARGLSNRVAGIDPLVRRSGRAAAAILATSEDTAHRIREMVGEQVPVSVMPSIGISPDPVPHSGGSAPRARNDLAGVVRLLFVGRLVPWKGCHLALRVVAGLQDAGVPVSLTILGKGPERRRLATLAAELSIVDRVSFIEEVGSADAVRQLYRDHDIFLFPSLHEAGGMALIEAMQEGLAPVCVGIGGPAVSVRDGAGYAVDPTGPAETVASMVAAIRKLAGDPHHYGEVAAAAAARVADQYTWASKGTALDAVYREVATVAQGFA